MFNTKDLEELIVGDETVKVYHNFYTNPSLILEKILNISPYYHKNDSLTFNGRYFYDLRHEGHFDKLNEIVEYFEKLSGQKLNHPESNIITNFQRWAPDKFNDYKNCYWWPHYDNGYTLLIYLNHDNKENGLNLYADSDYIKKQFEYFHEHLNPWQNKKHYKLLRHIKTPFNTAIFFNAKKLLHSCAVNELNYIENHRLSQAMFFA